MFVYFEAARPTEENARLVMDWRNDPDTLRTSYHQQPKQWPAFLDEFRSTYFTHEALLPLFALCEGQRVAFVRFLPYTDDALPGASLEIGINVDPARRGQGLGSAVIREATRRMLEAGHERVIAEVKQFNTGSIRAFESAGYRLLGHGNKTIDDTGEVVPIYRFVATRRAETECPPRKPVFIIAEAGSNWRCGTPERDLHMAKALIDVAAEAGADAVKFQTYRADTVYVPNAGVSNYLAESGIRKPIQEIFDDQAMPYTMIPKLAEHCAAQNIEFMSSPFSIDDAQAVDPHVIRHKIASYEISHPDLIAFLAETGKPLILSTGAATCEDIEWAMAHFYAHGGTDLTLLQCTAKYPAAPSTLNLNAIATLRERFGVPIGLSDHSRDPVVAPVAAVALGASVIEKHVTINNRLPGADHAFAVTPPELTAMVRAIRDAEAIGGPGVKEVLPEEDELRSFAQRAVQATRDVAKGDPLVQGTNIDVLRPGAQSHGAHPRHLPAMKGRAAARDLKLGEGVGLDDCE